MLLEIEMPKFGTRSFSLFASVLLLISSQLAADFTSYDLGVYGSQSWTNSGEEYPGSNFWAHQYWNSLTNKDDENNNVTHVGKDFAVNNQNDAGNVRSYGFGKIVGRESAYGQVSIQNFTSCGEYFTVNLLHSSGIDENIVSG